MIRIGAQVTDRYGRGLGYIARILGAADKSVIVLDNNRKIPAKLSDVDEVMDSMLGLSYFRINSFERA
jgi:hypothetical protein